MQYQPHIKLNSVKHVDVKGTTLTLFKGKKTVIKQIMNYLKNHD